MRAMNAPSAAVGIVKICELVFSHSTKSRAENSGCDLPLETSAGHEERRQQGHGAGHLSAAFVIDQQAPVALQTAKGLLDLPTARLEHEAGLVRAPDQLELDAVASQRGLGTLADKGEVGPDLAQCARRQLGLEQGWSISVLDGGGYDAQGLDQALGVGQKHALPALDLFVRIVPTRAGLWPGPHGLGIQDAGRGPPMATACQAQAG